MSTLKPPYNIQGVRRLPQYLRILKQCQHFGREHISSSVLAEQAQVPAITVKKDLQAAGATGKLRSGFHVADTIGALESFLGWAVTRKACVVGVGNLGAALMGFAGFAACRLEIAAAFDIRPDIVGQSIHGVQVYHTAQMASVLQDKQIHLAILAVPAETAQAVAQALTAAGIQAIWNFAPVQLELAPEVSVRQEDLLAGLAELCVKIK